MRERISAAAASVNVTTSSSVTSQRCGGCASHTRYAHRSASTDVLPDPAAADTSRLWPTVWIARRCSAVHLSVESGIGCASAAKLGGRLDHAIAIDFRQIAVTLPRRIKSTDAAIIAAWA